MDPTVPTALVDALGTPAGVHVEQHGDRVRLVLPRRAFALGGSPGLFLLLLGLAVCWAVLVTPFLAGFYATQAELLRSVDFLLWVAAPLLPGLCGLTGLWLRHRTNRVTVELRDGLLHLDEGPLPGTMALALRLDLGEAVVFEPGRIRLRDATGGSWPVLDGVRDARIGAWLALTLEQHRSRRRAAGL